MYVFAISNLRIYKRPALLLAFLLSSSALAACGQKDGSATAAGTSKSGDPIEELQPFIKERESKINDGGSWNPGDSLGARDISDVNSVTSFDVTETDSLVSPYLGTINYEVSYALTIDSKGETSSASAKCRESYAYQDDQWVLKSQEFVAIPEIDDSNWESYPAEKSLAAVACGFAES